MAETMDAILARLIGSSVPQKSQIPDPETEGATTPSPDGSEEPPRRRRKRKQKCQRKRERKCKVAYAQALVRIAINLDIPVEPDVRRLILVDPHWHSTPTKFSDLAHLVEAAGNLAIPADKKAAYETMKQELMSEPEYDPMLPTRLHKTKTKLIDVIVSPAKPTVPIQSAAGVQGSGHVALGPTFGLRGFKLPRAFQSTIDASTTRSRSPSPSRMASCA